MRRILLGGVAASLIVGCAGIIGDSDNKKGEAPSAFCADTPGVRRLTVPEYAASVAALLDVDISAEAVAEFPADLRTDGFTNTSSSLLVTDVHIEKYDTLGRLAVSRMSDVTEFVADRGVTCTEVTPACGQEVARSLADLMFRQPAVDAEVNELATIFDAVAAENETFQLGVELVLQAILQSPRFLYRFEDETGTAEIRAVDSYAMANRLSYLIWGAPPDGALAAAAAKNELLSDAEVEAQVRRMLAQPQAKATSRRYINDWLNLDRLNNLARNATEFPNWSANLGRAMRDETLDYAEYLMWDKGVSMSELFNGQVTFVTPELATYYGIDAPTADGRVDLTDVPERGGLLTQGGMVTIGGNSASMVGRGLHMMETFLCGEIGDPPSGVDTTPIPPEPGKSNRVVSEQRVDNPSCGGCHVRFEPMAWGLERFDATGAYSEVDSFANDLKQDGAVNFAGKNVEFASIGELGEILANSDVVRSCMASKASQFALGRKLDHDKSVSCSLDEVKETFMSSSGTYSDLMVAIALSPMFRHINTQSPTSE